MWNRLWWSVALVTGFSFAATAGLAEPRGGSAAAVPEALADRVDADAIAAVFENWNRSDGPGCVVAVSDTEGVVFEGGYGMANLEYGVPLRPDSVFYVASVAKQFTAASTALLVERGLLNWDDDARQYLPQLQNLEQPVTVRQLAQHTSGVRDYFGLFRLAGGHELDYLDNARVLAMLARQSSLQFTPGTLHDYSNSNYVLLVELVERLSGMSFLDFTQQEIFTPLGMISSRFEIDHSRVVPGRVASYQSGGEGLQRYTKEFDVVGDGGLLSTAADLTAWGRNLMRTTVLRGETLGELVRPGQLPDGSEFSYGLGHRVGTHRGTAVVGHTGGFKGFRTRIVAAPEHGLAVAVLCNAADANATRLSDAVLDVLLPEPEAEPEVSAPSTDSAVAETPVVVALNELQAWAGHYWTESDGHSRRIFVKDGVLHYGREGMDSPLAPLSADRFLMPGFGIRVALDFARDEAGQRILTFQVGDFETVRYQEYEPVDPARFNPDDYSGVYTSDELDARYRLDGQDGVLHLELASGVRGPLQPVMDDLLVGTFESRPHALRFTRDGSGEVSGFTITSGWIRDFRFARTQAR